RCSPIAAFRATKHGITARSILSNFLWYKKAGNARRKVLAYRSFPCHQARHNGEIHSEQFPMVQKSGQRPQEDARLSQLSVPPSTA
ncbi:MAG: hypothetical protein IJV98_00315, partial [Clostridia bacterium]|nr:hypothetical protein [Clostridia bacterium]